MNRRAFISSLLAGVVAPAFLPGADRKWKRTDAGLFITDQYFISPYRIQWWVEEGWKDYPFFDPKLGVWQKFQDGEWRTIS